MLFFLEYDLRQPHRDYQELYDELARFSAIRILESLWCFNRINTTAGKLRDHFSKFIDNNDGLCVSQINGWATRNTLDNPKSLGQKTSKTR